MEKLVSLPLLQWMSLCIVVQMYRCRAGRIKNVLLSNSVVAALEMCQFDIKFILWVFSL